MRVIVLCLLASAVFPSVSRGKAPVFVIVPELSTIKFHVKASAKIAGKFDKWEAALAVTPLSAPLSHATDAQIAEWKSMVLERSQSECRRVLWQIEGETLGDAIAIYERGHVPDDCLALLPTGEIVEGIPYGAVYIGFDGTFGGDSDTPDTADGFSENTCGVNFPGHCITYITDTPRPIL